MLEDFEFGSDEVQHQGTCLENAYKLEHLTREIDDALDGIKYAPRRPAGLTKADISEMTGFSEDELDAMQKTIQKRDEHRQELFTFLELAKRGGLPADQMKAFRLVEKSYARSASLTESMTEAVDLFKDYFSPCQMNLLERAVKALDLSAFIQILSSGMAKAKTVA